MNKIILLVGFLCCSIAFQSAAHSKVNAEGQSKASYQNKISQFSQWQESNTVENSAAKNNVLSTRYVKTYSTDVNKIRTLLLSDSNSVLVSLPLPNGKLVDFSLTPSSVISPELAQKYPNIKTYIGVDVSNVNNTGRFDITPNGFHGMFYINDELVFVEPETTLISSTIDSVLTDNAKQAKASKQTLMRQFNHNSLYQSYYGKKVQLSERADYQFHQPKTITTIAQGEGEYDTVETLAVTTAAKSSPSQSAIKTYRLAISAAAEYTEFNGGTVDSAMAEIITLVNRLNDVYQRDLAIKLELVADNDLLIFTDASSDPFTNTSDDGEINTVAIDNIIGNTSYDVGHVVSTGGGGLAVLNSVCSTRYKGDGVTGVANPTNDAFYIDYVAHEIGHQFGAAHTFNGTAGACADNRVETAAYEVGSGATIMGYAGICGSQNLQSHSDAYFHSKSIEQVSTFINSGNGRNCGSVTGVTNNTAIVDAGADYTIPANTPFQLSGSATDVDNDSLSYSWQQFDLGTASSSAAEQIDDGTRPLFRAWPPVTENYRVLPLLDDILAGTNTIGEVLPNTDRTLNFRLLVRDGEGGVSFDATEIRVVNTGEAFTVEAPLTSDIWSNNTPTVNWQVAQTDSTPINCAAVDILLSADGGSHFNETLATAVANNGSNTLSLAGYCPDDINTTTARVKVVCDDNIFFAINEGDFTINKVTSAADIAINSQQSISINQGESVTITDDLFTYVCGNTPSDFTVEAGSNYSVLENTITPNSDFFGMLNVGIIAHLGDVSSETYNVIITVIETVIPEEEIEEGVEEETVTEPEVTEPEETEAETASAVSEPAKSSSGSIYWLLSAFLILWLRNPHHKVDYV